MVALVEKESDDENVEDAHENSSVEKQVKDGEVTYVDHGKSLIIQVSLSFVCEEEEN